MSYNFKYKFKYKTNCPNFDFCVPKYIVKCCVPEYEIKKVKKLKIITVKSIKKFEREVK